ncbi:hypothetical protein EFA59_02735 [Weissella hellenica]|nr:hypothetical protein EFA59_02735 [Weissella hellenica]
MIYIFDKKQTIIKVLTNEDLTAGHLDLKINTATTFEFSLPANKPLPSNAKYVAVPHPLNSTKFILLRLTERTDNADTIDYSAYELAYQELSTDGYIADKRPANQDALTLMKTALNGSNWELNNVNVAGTASTNFYYIDHLTAISKVVELLGGEIVFYVEIQGNTISGRYMDYLARQGEDTSKVFANGSNLLTIERQSDTSGVYTAILPRGKGVQVDGDNDVSTPDGYGRRLNIADAVWKKSSGKPLDKPAGEIILRDPTANAEWGHINGNYRLLLETYDDIDDVNTLINAAYKTLQAVNHPKIQYSATIAEVGGLSLGDTVLIMHGERDLSYKTRVFEVDYDLLDPAQTQISLGDDLSSNSITSQINSVSSSQSIASEQTQWTINQIGRDSVTFGTEYPENPKVGDTFFKYLPNGDTVIYEWNGEIWEEKASTHTGADISAAIDDAIDKANKYTDELNEKQASEAAKFKSETTTALNSASADRERISKEATNMTNSAMARANEVANKAAEIDGKVVAVGKSIDGLTGVVNDKNKGLSAVFDLASNGQTLAVQAQKDATTAITTAQGVQTSVKQSQDDIKKLQDRLNAQGQANQLTNTEFNPDLEGWTVSADTGSKAPYRSYWNTYNQATTVAFNTSNSDAGTYTRFIQNVVLASSSQSGHALSASWSSRATQIDNYANLQITFYDSANKMLGNVVNKWAVVADGSWNDLKVENITVPDTATNVRISFEAREGTIAYLSHPMLVFGPTIGDYVAGTYNNNNLVESVRTQLAGQINDEVNDRKNGDSTTRTQLTNLIDQRVTSVEKGYQSYFDQKADGILLGVGTPNMLVNSDFNPDLSGWSVDNFLGGKKPYRSYFDKTANKITVGFNTQSDNASMASLSQKVALASTPGARGTISLSWQARTSESAGTQTVSMSFVDSSGNTIGKSITADWSDKGNGWNIKKIEGIDIPDKATSLTIAFVASEKVTAYLTKPMLSFTNKAMPYMPGSATNSSTVLQLFKDNWSIGLADNLGKITSGIVADNNNMALINKNITLQGNTTVTADFYAKGGNFKNLNASNITTGTINAAKINVINLDVSSLSGNITNFVKSYWANAYSNVTIDGSGMTISNGWDHTNLVNGSVDLSHYSTITSVEEHIGGLSTVNDVRADNLDLISIYIDGYKNQGSGHSAKHGGDGFSVSLTNGNGNATMTDVLSWENELLAGARKNEPGWHFWDDVKFHQPVLITPPGAYQGILFSTTKMSSTTYPAIFGNQKKNDGPGIVMGSTELYFIYKGTAYPLSGILTNAYYDI